MAGALTERDFVKKIEKSGFAGIRLHERRPVGIDDLALYPLFTPELLALMRRHIAPEAQQRIGVAIVLSAGLGRAAAGGVPPGSS